MAILKAKVASPSGRIPIPTVVESAGMFFSFKYVTTPNDGKFSLADRECGYFLALLTRMREICRMAATDFRDRYSKALRNHHIKFTDVTVTESGFSSLPDGLKTEVDPKAFQFCVDQYTHGRVHGFIIDDMFFVVWFDPRHELYGGTGYT